MNFNINLSNYSISNLNLPKSDSLWCQELKFTASKGMLDLNFRLRLSDFDLSDLFREIIKVIPERVKDDSLFWDLISLRPELLNPDLFQEADDQALKDQFLRIGDMSNKDIQLLLRESQSEVLIWAMWFIQNDQVEQAIFNNMSARAAEMLRDDLQANRDECGLPEEASLSCRARGKLACMEQVRLLDLVTSISP
jgi:hypothetical protein